MRVLQYNIWDGCHDEERYDQLHHFLVEKSYDVVGFNELKSWTETEFTQKMKACGYDYSYFFAMETSAYPIGIASKTPIETILTNEKDPFYHGMMHVKIANIHFIVAHLSPFTGEHRERETNYIAEYTKSIDGPLIVMGDLNTLSPLDKVHYDEMELLERLSATERGRECHMKNGEINYQPMQTLLDAGLHDVGRVDQLDYSMPTKVHANYKKRRYVRLDYVLVNDQLLEKKPSAQIIRNSEVEYISDHYPIECEFSF